MERTQNQRFLDLFWALSSTNPKEQTNAASTLIRSTDFCQKRYENENGAKGVERESFLCPEITYSLKRLTEGLNSNRNGSRIGFSIALTELLRCFPMIPLSRVSEKLLKPSEEDPGMELYLGTVFGVLAITRSERILKTLSTLSHQETSQFMEEVVCKLVTEILRISEKKIYLPVICFEILVELLRQIPKEPFKVYILPMLEKLLEMDPNEFTPEIVLLLINLRRIYGFNIKKYSHYLTHGKILHPTNLLMLKKALLASAYTSPKLHVVWKYVVAEVADAPISHLQALCDVIDEIFASPSIDSKNMGFQVIQALVPKLDFSKIQYLYTHNFLKTLISSLRTSTALHKVAQMTLSSIVRNIRSDPSAALAAITIFEGPSGATEFDYRTNTKTISALISVLTPESIQTFVLDLFNNFCDVKAVIEDDNADDGTLSNLISIRRRWAIKQLYGLVKGSTVPIWEKTVFMILQFIFFHAFYEYYGEDVEPTTKLNNLSFLRRNCHPPVSTTERVHLETTFFSLLNYLRKHNIYTETISKNGNKINSDKALDKNSKAHKPGTMSNNESWEYNIFLFLSQLEADSILDKISPKFDISNDTKERGEEDSHDNMDDDKNHRKSKKDKKDRNDKNKKDTEDKEDKEDIEDIENRENGMGNIKMQVLLKKISDRVQLLRKEKEKISSEKTPEMHSVLRQLKAFERLFINLGLIQLRNQEISESLEELCDIYSQLFDRSSKDKDTTVIMTDLFISWSTKSSLAVARDIIEEAYRSFCPCLDAQSINLLLDTVKTSFEIEEDEEEDEEEDDDEGEEEEEESDSEEDDDSQEEDKSEKKQEDESEKNEKEDNDSMEEAEELKTKKSKNKQKIETKEPDKQSKDSKRDSSETEEDETSISEDLVDDEHMFKLNKALAEMIKNSPNNRKKMLRDQMLKERNEIIQFRMRVISMIDIFLQAQHQNPLTYNITEPLLDAVTLFSSENDTSVLVQRLETLFNKMCRLKPPKVRPEDVPALHQTITRLFEKANTAKHPTVVIICGSGIVYLIKVLSLSQKRENQDDEEEMENLEKEENRKCHENFGSFDVSAFKDLFSNYFSQSIKKRTSPLTSSFFSPLVLKIPELGWQLVPTITGFLPDALHKWKIMIIQWFFSLVQMRQHMGPDASYFIAAAPYIYKAILVVIKEEHISSNDLRNILKLLQRAVQASITCQGFAKTQSVFTLSDITPLIESNLSKFMSNLNFAAIVKNVVFLMKEGHLPISQKGKKKKLTETGKEPMPLSVSQGEEGNTKQKKIQKKNENQKNNENQNNNEKKVRQSPRSKRKRKREEQNMEEDQKTNQSTKRKRGEENKEEKNNQSHVQGEKKKYRKKEGKKKSPKKSPKKSKKSPKKSPKK